MKSLFFLILVASVLTGCGASSDASSVDIEASIDELLIADATPSNPLPLDPREEATLTLIMTNTSGRSVDVHRVRVEGELLGLNFLTYDVRVRLTIEPGEVREVSIPLDFFELERQANGYLRSFVRVYDEGGERVGGRAFALDIRGDATSMMVLFSVGLFLITGVTAALNVRDLRRGQLPDQRFARGIRFLIPGLGLGLMLSIAFSVLRIFPLPATGWVPLTLIPALAGFAVGYAVVPGPEPDELWIGDDVENDENLTIHPDDREDVRPS